MRKTSLSVLVVATLAGCMSPASPDTRVHDDRATSRAQPREQHASGGQDDSLRGEAQRAEARREEDRREARTFEEPTAQDQPNSDTDLRIARELRQRVVGHDDLSMGAKNCTIIARGGVVTLRGEVESEDERTLVASLAQGVDGVRQVDDQLIVDSD